MASPPSTHLLSPFPTVMNCTIPSSPTLLSACARLHRRLPCLFSITDCITCSRHRRCQPQPRSHPRLHRNDTPIIYIRWHKQSHYVRRILGYYSLPRPKRAQACRRYLSTLPAAWPCAGSGRRLIFTYMRLILSGNTAPFISAMP